jgi:hypothetical protein
VECCAFHAGHELNRASVSDIEDEAVDDFVAEVPVGHLAALETKRGLNLVAVAEEADGLVLLRLVVVLVYGDGELDLFDGDDLLLLAGGAVALVFLVKELAVVLDFADGWNSVGGDLYEIEGALTCHLKGFERRHNAKLLAVLVDDTDFACADAFVSADERLGGTFIDWWNRSLHSGSVGLAMRCFGFGAPCLLGCAGTRSITLSCYLPAVGCTGSRCHLEDGYNS